MSDCGCKSKHQECVRIEKISACIDCKNRGGNNRTLPTHVVLRILNKGPKLDATLEQNCRVCEETNMVPSMRAVVIPHGKSVVVVACTKHAGLLNFKLTGGEQGISFNALGSVGSEVSLQVNTEAPKESSIYAFCTGKRLTVSDTLLTVTASAHE